MNLATDFNFKARPRFSSGQQNATSDVQTDVAFAPARWLQVDAYSSLTPQTLTMQEFNTGMTLHDGDAWSVRFLQQFLALRQIEDYLTEVRLLLSHERYRNSHAPEL